MITALNNNIAAGTPFAGFLFDANAPAYTFSGNTVTLTNASIVNNSLSLQTINLALASTNALSLSTTAGGGNLLLKGNISGLPSWSIGGSGTVTLTATNSTGTGATVVSGAAGDTLVVQGGSLSGGQVEVGVTTPSNNMVVSGGGRVSATTTTLGFLGTSASNSALVTGVGSLWTNSGDFIIGKSDKGHDSLVVSNGGTVADVNGWVGYTIANAVNNTALVTGAGSLWSNSTYLFIGSNSVNNSLVISNGGTVVSSNGMIGFSTAANNNSVLVTGTGSLWSNNAVPDYMTIAMSIGVSGSSNSLVISNGGVVIDTSSWTYVGSNAASSNNSVLVTGTNSLFRSGQDLVLGLDGSGNSMVISNGATVKVTNELVLGYSSYSSNNTVLVTGAGTLLDVYAGGNASAMDVGLGGSGNSLVISNGATVLTTRGGVSDNGGVSNSVLVTGAGSLWSNSDGIYLDSGFGGSATLTIASGGTVAADTGSIFGHGVEVGGGTGTSTLNIGTPGGADTNVTLITASVSLNDTNASITFNQADTVTMTSTIIGAGNLNQLGTGTTILANYMTAPLPSPNTYSGPTTIASGVLQVGNGGTPGNLGTGPVIDNASLVFDHSNTISVPNTISGTGSLSQIGSGTLDLTGSNSYTGTTTVAGGTSTLEVGTTGTLSGTTNVAVNGGTLLLEGNAQVNPINPSATLTTAAGSTLVMGASGSATRALTQSFSNMTLSGNTVINFSALTGLSTLQLAALTMNGNSLTILNWEGTTYNGSVVGTPANDTHLMDLSGLTQSELNSISFYSGSTTSSGFLGTAIFSLTNPNEIIPVPEPTVVISGLFLLGWLIAGAARGRKKLKS